MAENDSQELDRQVRILQEQNHERAKEVAVLRADMKTLQSDLQGTLERFRADMANLKTDMAGRENRQLLAILGGIAVATAILGVLIAGIPAA